jgi:hypothetical protein
MCVEAWIVWQKPNDDWVRLNINGANIGGHVASCGGIFRETDNGLPIFLDIWEGVMHTSQI